MKREIFKNPDLGPGEILKYFLLAAAIVAGALFCVCHSSCQLTSQGIQALGAEDSPKIVGVSVLNSNRLRWTLSRKIQSRPEQILSETENPCFTFLTKARGLASATSSLAKSPTSAETP